MRSRRTSLEQSLLIIVSLAFVLIVFPQLAHASTADDTVPEMTGPIMRFIRTLVGPICYALGIGGLIGMAYMALDAHDLTEKTKIVVTGICFLGVIVGAKRAYTSFFGADAAVIASQSSHAAGPAKAPLFESDTSLWISTQERSCSVELAGRAWS